MLSVSTQQALFKALLPLINQLNKFDNIVLVTETGEIIVKNFKLFLPLIWNVLLSLLLGSASSYLCSFCLNDELGYAVGKPRILTSVNDNAQNFQLLQISNAIYALFSIPICNIIPLSLHTVYGIELLLLKLIAKEVSYLNIVNGI